jgi:hypothetical protein
MKAAVSAVHDNGEIVQLLLTPSAAMLAEQARVVAACIGQIPFSELHITLASSAASDKPLPSPPAYIEFFEVAERVERSDKTSVYLRVSEASQAQLTQYVAKLEAALGVTGLQNPSRLFHASLSNLVGTPRGSIAKIWEHASTPV